MKNCEICGTVLTDSNRSKSYKNRCKACVAKQTKAKRHGEKPATTDNVSEAIKKSLSRLTDELVVAVGRFDKAEVIENGELICWKNGNRYKLTLNFKYDVEKLEAVTIKL